MSIERVEHNGMLVVTDLVTRKEGTVGPPGEPREWFHSEKYIDYGEDEALAMFVQSVDDQGLVIVE